MRTTGDGTWLRAAALVALLALGGVLGLIVDVPDVGVIRGWVSGAGPVGWTALVLAVAVVLLAPVPRSAVSALIGVVVGFAAGLGVAFAGGLLASLVAFGLSRTLGRSAATRLAGARLDRVDDLMARRGFAAILIGRLLPMMPFVVLSYGAGLTAIRWGPYAAGNAVGLVPGTVIQVGVGASALAVVENATPLTVLPLVGAAAVLAALSVGAWLLRRRATTA